MFNYAGDVEVVEFKSKGTDTDDDGNVKTEVELKLGLDLPSDILDELPMIGQAIRHMLAASQKVGDDKKNDQKYAPKFNYVPCNYELGPKKSAIKFSGKMRLRPAYSVVHGEASVEFKVDIAIDPKDLVLLGQIVGGVTNVVITPQDLPLFSNGDGEDGDDESEAAE